MAIKGSLKEASLPDVCQLLTMGRKSGCLSVSDRARFGQIFFQAGRITFASVVNRRDRLGDLLVRDGILGHERLQQVIEQQVRQPDRRLGEILIEEGLLTPGQLGHYIRSQVEEAVYLLFTWTRGSFSFELDALPPPGEIRLSINPEMLLLEGARRIDEWSLIEKKIPTLDLIFDLEQDRVTQVTLAFTPAQERIMPLLDGGRTVQDLIDETGLGEFETGKALFGLLQAGFAHRVGQRTGADPETASHADTATFRNLGTAFYRTGMLDEAADAFGKVLGLQPADVGARFHLALIALRLRQNKKTKEILWSLLADVGPSHAILVDLAVALSGLNRPDDALLLLDEAESISPGRAAVPLVRAAILLDRGDLDGVATHLALYRSRVPARDRPAVVAFHHAALAAALRGRVQEAEAIVREGLHHHPTAAALLLLAGTVAERRGDFDAADHNYRQAAEEDPTLAQPHKGLGDLAYRQKRFEEAFDHYRRAVQLSPDLGDDVFTRLGNLRYRRKEVDEALSCWRRALDLNPDNQTARNNLEVVSSAR